VQSVISITFLIASINHLLGLYQTIGMLFIFLACLGISNPNTAVTLAPFTKKCSASQHGAIQLGLGAFALLWLL
jgi:DHA1 family bicyclomycin/chloramphenicol resistance-like MFS transporter